MLLVDLASFIVHCWRQLDVTVMTNYHFQVRQQFVADDLQVSPGAPRPVLQDPPGGVGGPPERFHFLLVSHKGSNLYYTTGKD